MGLVGAAYTFTVLNVDQVVKKSSSKKICDLDCAKNMVDTNRSRHIGVAYLADPQRLLLLGRYDHNHYRSQGAAAERTVVKVEVLSEEM